MDAFREDAMVGMFRLHTEDFAVWIPLCSKSPRIGNEKKEKDHDQENAFAGD